MTQSAENNEFNDPGQSPAITPEMFAAAEERRKRVVGLVGAMPTDWETYKLGLGIVDILDQPDSDPGQPNE